jgi:hypothetical protein
MQLQTLGFNVVCRGCKSATTPRCVDCLLDDASISVSVYGCRSGRPILVGVTKQRQSQLPKDVATDRSATFYCGATKSAPLFDAVRAQWLAFDLGMPMPTPMLGLSVHSDVATLGPYAMLYSLANTHGGLMVNGVAYAGILDCKRNMFMQMQTNLPSRDRELATIMLEFYSQRYIEEARRHCR